MKNKNIVTIGGGTGSFMLLSGLKKYQVDLSAIVSMADDGGSTGVLRDELGVLPPGDVRQCLVALSDSSEILRKLLSYRFEEGGLKGHNFGNLFLSTLEKISGSFEIGIEEAIKILNVKGKIIPVTNDDARIFLKLKNGNILKGEDNINKSEIIQKDGFEKLYFEPAVKASQKAIQHILEADLILIGPGGFYTSILPNLLAFGISEAINNSKAIVIYNCNLTNKKGQTDGFSLDDYAKEVNAYMGKDRLDFVIYNSKKPDEKLIEKYQSQQQQLVEFDPGENKNRTYKVISADVLSDEISEYGSADVIASTRALIRHDSNKLAKAIFLVSEMENYKNIIKDII